MSTRLINSFRSLSTTSLKRDGSKYVLPQGSKFPIKRETMLPKDTYKDKVVFITGGGTGLGKGMATKFSDLGAKVVIAARRLPVLEKTASEIEGLTGNPVLPLQCDVRDPEAIKATVDTVVDQLGLPNVVVNNAAGNFISPTERLSPKGFKNIVDIVLNGTMMVTLDIGKRLIAAGQGAAFLAITAHISNEGSAFVVPSATSKSGVETMMKSLGVEWGKYGIRMNCIAPGIFYTEGAFSRLDPTEALIKDHIKIIPAGRLGEVEEIANLATYLCSDYASWVNAEVYELFVIFGDFY